MQCNVKYLFWRCENLNYSYPDRQKIRPQYICFTMVGEMTCSKLSATKNVVFCFIEFAKGRLDFDWANFLGFALCHLSFPRACFTLCLWTSKQIILSLSPATRGDGGDSHMVGANGLTINVLEMMRVKLWPLRTIVISSTMGTLTFGLVASLKHFSHSH